MISENEKQTDWRYGWRFRLFNAKSAVATETLFFEPKLIKFGENSLWPAFFYILGNKIHSNKHCLAMNVSYCVVRQRSSAEHKDAFNMEMSVRCIFDSLIVDVYGCRNRAHSHVMTIFDMVITFFNVIMAVSSMETHLWGPYHLLIHFQACKACLSHLMRHIANGL